MCNHNADTCTATRCLPWKILICKCQPRKGRKGTAGCRGDKTGPEREGDERDPPSPGTCVWGQREPGRAHAGTFSGWGWDARAPPARPQPPSTPSAEPAPAPLQDGPPPLCTQDPPGARGNPLVHVGPSPRTWDPLARVAPSSKPRRRTPWGLHPVAGTPPLPPACATERGTAPCPRPRHGHVERPPGAAGFWRRPRLGAACQRLQSPRRAALQPCLLFPGSVPLREPPAPGVVPD